MEYDMDQWLWAGGGVGRPLGPHSSGDLFATSAFTTVSKAALSISTALCLVSVSSLRVGTHLLRYRV
jgi:hypothetical protein